MTAHSWMAHYDAKINKQSIIKVTNWTFPLSEYDPQLCNTESVLNFHVCVYEYADLAPVLSYRGHQGTSPGKSIIP